MRHLRDLRTGWRGDRRASDKGILIGVAARDVVDKRSLYQLLDRGGVRELCREQAPSVGEFITAQRFLGNEQVLEAISRRLMVTPLA